jgi:hypothetical protein
MPKQMNYNDGESIVKKASGLIKVRKGQSEQEYNTQKENFWDSGPVVQNHTYTTEYVSNTIENQVQSQISYTERSKIERENIMHGLERLYFERKYDRCLKDAQLIIDDIHKDNPNIDLNLKQNKNLKRIVNELENISKMCINKINNENQLALSNI